MARIRKSLLILSLAASVFFAHGSVSPAQEGFSDQRQGRDGHLIRLASSRGGQNSLLLERDLRDALISNPPFSESAQGSVAPAPQAPMDQSASARPEVIPHRVPENTAPVQGQRAYFPAPPPTVPEVLVRGYSIDPSGVINIVGMDGVIRTIDGSQQVKLVFPPEYGLAPLIVGGGSPAPPDGGQMQAYGPEAVPAQDGTGVQPAPPVAGGGGEVQVSASGGGALPAVLIQEGIGLIMRQIQNGSKRTGQ